MLDEPMHLQNQEAVSKLTSRYSAADWLTAFKWILSKT